MPATPGDMATGEAAPEGAADARLDGEAPSGAPLDIYGTLDRTVLLGALRDRERDLAQARRELHEALDARARLALDVSILRGALTDREADLAGVRGELHALLDRHAELALDRDILKGAIHDREVDLADAREEMVAGRVRITELEQRVEGTEVAEGGPRASKPDRPAGPRPATSKPSTAWDDFVFYVRYMFNLHDR